MKRLPMLEDNTHWPGFYDVIFLTFAKVFYQKKFLVSSGSSILRSWERGGRKGLR